MNQEIITNWLRKWSRNEALVRFLGGVAVLMGGILLLAATWGLVYLVSLFALGPWLGYRHWSLGLIAFIILPLLFWGNARTSREYLSEYQVTCGTASDQVVTFYLPGLGMCSNMNPLAPKSIHTAAKMITDCLYLAPRVIVYAFKLFRKSMQLKRLDVEGCGAVLTVLALARGRLSFQEIFNAVEGLDPTRVFPQMGFIEGVLFLQSDPAGLTLSPELRQAIRSYAAVCATAGRHAQTQ